MKRLQMSKTETRVLTVHVPVPLAEKVDDLARRMERSRGWILKQALAAWIAQEEERIVSRGKHSKTSMRGTWWSIGSFRNGSNESVPINPCRCPSRDEGNTLDGQGLVRLGASLRFLALFLSFPGLAHWEEVLQVPGDLASRTQGRVLRAEALPQVDSPARARMASSFGALEAQGRGLFCRCEQI